MRRSLGLLGGVARRTAGRHARTNTSAASSLSYRDLVARKTLLTGEGPNTVSHLPLHITTDSLAECVHPAWLTGETELS